MSSGRSLRWGRVGGLYGAYRGGILGSQVINPGMSRSAMSGPKWAVLEGAGGEAIIAIVSTSPAQRMCTIIRLCTIIRKCTII